MSIIMKTGSETRYEFGGFILVEKEERGKDKSFCIYIRSSEPTMKDSEGSLLRLSEKSLHNLETFLRSICATQSSKKNNKREETDLTTSEEDDCR